MAYEGTEVPVARSQEAIRKIIMAHGGYGIAFVSDSDPDGKLPPTEGFHAKVVIDGKPYAVRISAKLRECPPRRTERQREDFADKEARRVWRVLFYHVKSVFEAADSGVMEFRELMLPYIIVGERTIAEHLLPRLDAAIAGNRLLTNGEN